MKKFKTLFLAMALSTSAAYAQNVQENVAADQWMGGMGQMDGYSSAQLRMNDRSSTDLIPKRSIQTEGVASFDVVYEDLYALGVIDIYNKSLRDDHDAIAADPVNSTPILREDFSSFMGSPSAKLVAVELMGLDGDGDQVAEVPGMIFYVQDQISINNYRGPNANINIMTYDQFITGSSDKSMEQLSTTTIPGVFRASDELALQITVDPKVASYQENIIYRIPLDSNWVMDPSMIGDKSSQYDLHLQIAALNF